MNALVNLVCLKTNPNEQGRHEHTGKLNPERWKLGTPKDFLKMGANSNRDGPDNTVHGC